MKLTKLLIIIGVIGLITFGFKFGFLQSLYNQAFKGLRTSLTKTAQIIQVENIRELQINLPGPLRKLPTDIALSDPSNTINQLGSNLSVTEPKTPSNTSSISVNAIITATNNARKDNGNLKALSENKLLDASAKKKLDDLFTKQYFEHVSPTGVVLGDIANTVGYEYIVIGENLALGNFSSGQEFVDEWMKSPGHRANILNTRYQEIGVAVRKGMYQGKETWIGVQHFGKPTSSCPSVDQSLKASITELQNTITSERGELDKEKAVLDATPASSPEYSSLVDKYNALAGEFNVHVKLMDTKTVTYNNEVKSFNQCVEGK